MLFPFFALSDAVPCENADVEYPKGFASPGSGDGILLSNLAFSSTHIFSGGQHDSAEVYEGGIAHLNAGGIPFINK